MHHTGCLFMAFPPAGPVLPNVILPQLLDSIAYALNDLPKKNMPFYGDRSAVVGAQPDSHGCYPVSWLSLCVVCNVLHFDRWSGKQPPTHIFNHLALPWHYARIETHATILWHACLCLRVDGKWRVDGMAFVIYMHWRKLLMLELHRRCKHVKSRKKPISEDRSAIWSQ